MTDSGIWKDKVIFDLIMYEKILRKNLFYVKIMYTSDIEFALKNSNNLLFFRHICLIVAFLKAFLELLQIPVLSNFLNLVNLIP